MDVTVNALAIENEAPDLASWYSDHLITGSGAFVMRVGGFETFADAIAMKLIREVTPPNLALDVDGKAPPSPGADAPPLAERDI